MHPQGLRLKAESLQYTNPMERQSDKKPAGQLKRMVLIVSGSTLLALGAVGIFVPILPTTPFVIGAALCYGRSASRIGTWLKRNRYFGPYIESYRSRAGLPLRSKIQGLAFLWPVLLLSILLLQGLAVKLILITVGIAVTAHLLLLKTRAKE